MRKIQRTYAVVSNKQVSKKLYHLCLNAGQLTRSIKPGQFIHIKVNEGVEPFFRRPFSVYRSKKHVEILYEVVGKGTNILSSRKKGDKMDVLGPLGNVFSLPPKNIKRVVMIAGGVGVAPLMALSDLLMKKKINLVLLYGARNKDYIFDMKEFEKNGCKIFISTDDGSKGVKGKVSKLFSKINKDLKNTMIYSCGPRPMMAAVQGFAKKNGIKGKLACEEIMACGLGACLGCSIKTVSGYKTVCHDGPVFDIEEVVF